MSQEKLCPFCGARQHRYLPAFLCGTTSSPDSSGEYSTGGECDRRSFGQAVIRYDDACKKVIEKLAQMDLGLQVINDCIEELQIARDPQ